MTGGNNCKQIRLQVFLDTNRKTPPISMNSAIYYCENNIKNFLKDRDKSDVVH
jgi:hypothetical protein